MREKSFGPVLNESQISPPPELDLDRVARICEAYGAVAETLEYFGYAFDQPKPGDFRFKLVTGPGLVEWRSQILVGDSGVLRLTVFLTDAGHRVTRQYWCGDLAHRCNYQTNVFCSFAMDWQTGSVELRQALDFRYEAITKDRLIAFLNTVSFPLGIWYRAYAYRDNLKVSAADAMAVSLIYSEIEPLQIAPATMKKFMRVVKGEGCSISDTNAPPPNLTLR